ncbi:MAG: hypothetical protein AAFX50_11780 [Acidobacteriota bacterium]
MTARRPRARLRPSVRALALAAVLLTASGCLYVKSPGALFGGLLTMRVTTVPTMNQDMPVAVEVLVVYDAKVLDQVGKLSAAEWFEGRTQFLRDQPPGTDTYQTWRWEWVPAQNVPDQEMRYALGARSTVVFVSYQTPGAHRAQVAPRSDFLLSLGRNDFEARTLE